MNELQMTRFDPNRRETWPEDTTPAWREGAVLLKGENKPRPANWYRWDERGSRQWLIHGNDYTDEVEACMLFPDRSSIRIVDGEGV